MQTSPPFSTAPAIGPIPILGPAKTETQARAIAILSEGSDAKAGTTTATVGGTTGGILLAIIIAAIILFLVLRIRKRRASEAVENTDSDEPIGDFIETLATFKVQDNYITQEGLSDNATRVTVAIPDEW
jgi:hypothetical protein